MMVNVIHLVAVIHIVVTEAELATAATDHLGLGEIGGSGAELSLSVWEGMPTWWRPWGPWGACSGSCNIGTQMRRRACWYGIDNRSSGSSSPSTNARQGATNPLGVGTGCFGFLAQVKGCSLPACVATSIPRSPWSEWSACNAPCGASGEQFRTRQCHGPAAECTGETFQRKVCRTSPCPTNPCTGVSCAQNMACNNGACVCLQGFKPASSGTGCVELGPEYVWGTWSSSGCSQSCGGGTITFSRPCMDDSGQTISESFCPGGSSKSSTLLSCNTMRCPPVVWDCKNTMLDLVFLIDGSASIEEKEFQQVLQWILQLVDELQPALAGAETKPRIVIVQYSSNVRIELEQTIQESSEEIKLSVEAIKQLDFGEHAYRALRFINSEVVTRTRPGSDKILITITDGLSTVNYDADAVNRTRSNFEIMLAIGVGNQVDDYQLQDLSHNTEPILINSFDSLSNITELVAEVPCSSVYEASQCSSSPCRNDGRCIVNEQNTDYSCECPTGYGDKDCSKVVFRLLKEIDPDTEAIHLKCVFPEAIKSQVTWRHNKIEVDRTEHWVKFEDGERQLTIERPRFTNSGEFSCQITDEGFERHATLLVKIDATVESACGESPGLSKRMINAKIKDGQITKLGEAPFVAMLHKEIKKTNLGSGVFCGGALITTRHVITAAHCFQSISPKETTVYVGKYVADVGERERMQQSSIAKSVFVHPDYIPETLHADYAILTIENEFYFSSFVKPICIAKPDNRNDEITPDSPPGKTKYGVVYGWGITNNGFGADQLRDVIVPIKRTSECVKSYEKGEITSYMFCAGGGNHGDACKGDSGGPFALWSTKRNRWYLGGLVSKGEKCIQGRQGSRPGVYARIGKDAHKWIYHNTDLTL